MRHLRYIFILLTTGMALTACNVNGCLENRSSVPLAGFYSSDSTAIRLDSLLIYGLGRPDTDPLSSPGTSISTVYLPMRSTEQQTAWVFAYKWENLDYKELNDTISFDYTTQPYFISDECGVIYKYHIDRVSWTSHLIEGVEVTDSLVTNTDVQRINIYFRTAQEEPEL